VMGQGPETAMEQAVELALDWVLDWVLEMEPAVDLERAEEGHKHTTRPRRKLPSRYFPNLGTMVPCH